MSVLNIVALRVFCAPSLILQAEHGYPKEIHISITCSIVSVRVAAALHLC